MTRGKRFGPISFNAICVARRGIVTNSKAIEVETPKTVKSGLQQLQGHKKPSYIAGTNQAAVDKALELTKNTTVGVMDNQGNIVKSSSRKKPK